MSNGYQQLSAKEWKNLEGKWLASNLSQPEFCHKQGIKYTQFAYWRGKFISAAKNQTQPSGFAEVVINNNKMQPINPLASQTVKPSLAHGENNHLQIKLPTGIHIIVGDGFNLSVLKEVLYLLGAKS